MINAEDRSVIDAASEGVHARNTQRLLFEEKCVVHVLHLRAGISDTQLAAVLNLIRGHIGTQYSAKEAMLTVLRSSHLDRKRVSNRCPLKISGHLKQHKNYWRAHPPHAFCRRVDFILTQSA